MTQPTSAISNLQHFTDITELITKEMMMDYLLEKEIRLNIKPKGSIPSWSLQEINVQNGQAGNEQIPYMKSLYFIGSELRIIKELEFKSRRLQRNQDENELFELSDRISGILHPGICNDGKSLENDTTFSMFGTDRRIDNFWISIEKINEDEKEYCELRGTISHNFEVYFENITEKDSLGIVIYLSPNKFDDLEKIIYKQREIYVELRLAGVSGFYTDVSFEGITNQVKILIDGDGQQIVAPEGYEIKLPRLGEIEEFDFLIIQRQSLNPKLKLQPIDIYKFFEEKNMSEDSYVDIQPRLLRYFSQNEIALAKLLKLVQFIFYLLLAMFFYNLL